MTNNGQGETNSNTIFLRGQAGGDGRLSAEMKLSGVAITDNDECLKPVQLVNIYSHKEKVK